MAGRAFRVRNHVASPATSPLARRRAPPAYEALRCARRALSALACSTSLPISMSRRALGSPRRGPAAGAVRARLRATDTDPGAGGGRRDYTRRFRRSRRRSASRSASRRRRLRCRATGGSSSAIPRRSARKGSSATARYPSSPRSRCCSASRAAACRRRRSRRSSSRWARRTRWRSRATGAIDEDDEGCILVCEYAKTELGGATLPNPPQVQTGPQVVAAASVHAGERVRVERNAAGATIVWARQDVSIEAQLDELLK